jgi:hypothetical protein
MTTMPGPGAKGKSDNERRKERKMVGKGSTTKLRNNRRSLAKRKGKLPS